MRERTEQVVGKSRDAGSCGYLFDHGGITRRNYRNLQTAHSSDCEKHLKLHKCSCFLWKTDIIYFVCLSIDISCC